MYLADAYMSIWVHLEEISSIALLVPKATPEEEHMVGFYLLIPMGYLEYATFFCSTTETVKDRALDTLPQ